jgi:GT2 family glycosyltransferase
VSSLIKPGDVGVEIGVALGVFAYHVLLPRRPRKLYLVDPWQYGLQADLEPDVTAEKQLQRDEQFECTRRLFAGVSNVEILRMRSRDAAAGFTDGSLDYVYIDGEHSYDAVFEDLASYLPKVKIGGYLIGDDYGWSGVGYAVDAFVAAHAGELTPLVDPYSEAAGGQFVLRKESVSLRRPAPARPPAADIAPNPSAQASPAVSIVHVTHRREPAFAWFVDSLARQLRSGDDVEVVFVDGLHGPERSRQLAQTVAGRFPFRHVPPKPTAWNGPHRRTRANYSAVGSARNTGIVYARHPYIVFVDDACVLMGGWWEQVRAAARNARVVGGAYQKHYEMTVHGGVLISSRLEADGQDSRWDRGDDATAVPIGGGDLFGAGLAAPRELLVELNGFDELCDPTGGEDYHLGLRIELSGVPLHYCRAMLVVESQELHLQAPDVVRRAETLDPASYRRRLREFGVAQRSTAGPCDAGHMILDILLGTRAVTTMGNHYALRTLTEFDLPGTAERLPHSYWFDHRPLSLL